MISYPQAGDEQAEQGADATAESSSDDEVKPQSEQGEGEAMEERIKRARAAQLFRAQMKVTNSRKGYSHMLTWQVLQRVDTERLHRAVTGALIPQWVARIRSNG